MRRMALVLLCAVLMLAPACGSGAATSSDDDPVPADGNSLTNAPEPEPEPEGENEAPDEGGAGPVAVQLPGLPVGGGSQSESPTHQCVDVGWSEPPDIPSWLEVRLTGVAFTPPGDFALSSQPCPGDAPRCEDAGFRLTNTSRCALAVKWTKPSSEGPLEVRFTGGTMFCPAGREAECRTFLQQVQQRGPEALRLDPSPEGFGGDQPADEPSEDATNGPADDTTDSTDGSGG